MSYLGIPNRDFARFTQELVESGRWSAQVGRRSRHIRLRHESGAIYFTGSTPSDRRALLNLRSDIRKIEQSATIIPPEVEE